MPRIRRKPASSWCGAARSRNSTSNPPIDGRSAATSIWPRSFGSSRPCRPPSSITAATGTVSSRSAKSIPITIRSRSPTGRRSSRRKPATSATPSTTRNAPRGRRGRRRSSAARARDRGDTVASERQEADETSAAPADADPASPVDSDQDGSEQGNGDGFETEQAGHDRADDAAETLSAAEEAEERRDPVDQDENGRDDVDESGDDNGYSAEALGAEAPEDENGEADGNGEPVGEEQVVEDLGGGDALEEVSERRHRPVRRHYKIQEVIKRRQILLVQVVKEERGNKGAAMTTYLSLAGRYSVLMPNTARGGGISRKITSAEDRKRLKEVAQDLEVPQGMGIILRTAGASRTKPEIKRDYEYLMRLWESVRELTLKSSAPALVYEEGSLIKRAIRDLYNKEIDEILVAGEEGYREAKDFMRMLMPSHAKAVQLYKEEQPLFAKYGIEAQLDAMFSSQVQLKSGGYLVINPTEALVSIDVNSGRSTREHNIEDTALRTNLEAVRGDRPAAAAARPGRPHRHRLHRHGGEAQQPRRREEAQGQPQERPRPHPGRAHLAVRPDGNVAAAHPHGRAGELVDPLPALRRHRRHARDAVGRPAPAAHARGNPDQERGPQPRRAHPRGSRFLRAQPQAHPSARSRKPFRRAHRHRRPTARCRA